jgi:hypothetical protein
MMVFGGFGAVSALLIFFSGERVSPHYGEFALQSVVAVVLGAAFVRAAVTGQDPLLLDDEDWESDHTV